MYHKLNSTYKMNLLNEDKVYSKSNSHNGCYGLHHETLHLYASFFPYCLCLCQQVIWIGRLVVCSDVCQQTFPYRPSYQSQVRLSYTIHRSITSLASNLGPGRTKFFYLRRYPSWPYLYLLCKDRETVM